MKKQFFAMAAGWAAMVSTAQAQQNSGKFSVAVQQHIDAANFIGRDLPPTLIPNLTSVIPGSGLPRNANRAVAPPTRVFDQLYFLGMGSVGSWALVTSDGIIQFDTLDNSEEAERIIEGGYRELGLDPRKIKYVIISHGHFDHSGGAQYLQNKFQPRVLMSAADWNLTLNPPARPAGRGPGAGGNAPPPRAQTLPRHDMEVTDGQKLTLGNTTVTLYLTPGHTPGTISAIIPVTHEGKPHMIAFWGGTGFPTTMEATASSGGLIQYEQSLKRFTQIGVDAGVDGIISNHAELDGSFEKVKEIRNLKPGSANPFLMGQSTWLRYMGVIFEFMEASKTLVREAVANPPAAAR